VIGYTGSLGRIIPAITSCLALFYILFHFLVLSHSACSWFVNYYIIFYRASKLLLMSVLSFFHGAFSLSVSIFHFILFTPIHPQFTVLSRLNTLLNSSTAYTLVCVLCYFILSFIHYIWYIFTTYKRREKCSVLLLITHLLSATTDSLQPFCMGH